MELDNNSERLQLSYPCEWVYKVIGQDPEFVRQAISEIIQGKPFKLGLSNQSKTKKYTAFNLEMTVESEGERNAFYSALKNHPAIKMVL